MVGKLTGRSRRKEGGKGKKENVEAEKDRRDVRSRGKTYKRRKEKKEFWKRAEEEEKAKE